MTKVMNNRVLVSKQPRAPQEEIGKPAPFLIVLLIVPLVGILLALLSLAQELALPYQPQMPDYSAAATGLLNNPAPDFTLNTLDGTPVTLHEMRGKTVFLNFWQTTCAPCVHELPDFVDFEQDFGTRATVLAVNFDETSTLVRDFFAANDIVGVNVLMDPTGDVREEYGVRGLPTTFVINANGEVRFVNIGPLTYDDMIDFLELSETTTADL